MQIVCGPYPDENMMEARWENEGGKPYETIDFSVVHPQHFDFADRRIKQRVGAGIVPVIVGGWGRPQGGGESTLAQVGLDGLKRHWRNLIARYGAYPTVWIVGGEAKGTAGMEIARYDSASGKRTVVAGDGQGATYLSADGLKWEQTPNTNASLIAVFGEGVFLGSNWRGRIRRSLDAIAGENVLEAEHHLEAIAFG